MKHLLTLADKDVFDTPTETPIEFHPRLAARAIVLDEYNAVYLLKMATQNYHKLPGGGVDEGESLQDAVYRELLEEIGCPAEIQQEVGGVVEYRNEWAMVQTSYCYIAKKTGPLRKTALEKDEIADGAQTIIVANIGEAITLLENDQPANYDGMFIQKRDLCLLREAKSLLM